MATKVFAPAKINLTLHVTGQRDDGYHLLDSLVTFAPVGDILHIQPGPEVSLVVGGPEGAGVPGDMGNLVMKVAGLLSKGRGAAMTLVKNLPVAAGIGGGSADAAAAFRGLMAFWDDRGFADLPDAELAPLAKAMMRLGADIPMCLLSCPARVRGIGEMVDPVAGLPSLAAVLVNPRVAVPTPSIFAALRRKSNPPMSPQLPSFAGPEAFINWLAQQRNDLQEPAIATAPIIGTTLEWLRRSQGCLLARMSGSGATCFGLYPDLSTAKTAAAAIAGANPAWWVEPCVLQGQFDRAQPQVS